MTIMTTTRIAALVACMTAAICSACQYGTENDHPIAGSASTVVVSKGIPPNPWQRPRPTSLVAESWQEIPSGQVHEIPTDALAIALSKLDKSAVVELDATEFQFLGMKTEAPAASNMHFLARAVADDCAGLKQKLYVARFKDSVLIQSSTFSASGSTEKCAVVLEIGFRPTDIFVEAGSLR